MKSGQNSTTEKSGDLFQPDYCVTLIDDIQAVQRRIASGINLRLRELLTWRSFEILLTDLLAKETILKTSRKFNSVDFPFDRSPIVAIRHPPAMLFQIPKLSP